MSLVVTQIEKVDSSSVVVAGRSFGPVPLLSPAGSTRRYTQPLYSTGFQPDAVECFIVANSHIGQLLRYWLPVIETVQNGG